MTRVVDLIHELLVAWRREYRRILHDPAGLLLFGIAVLAYAFFYPLPYLRQVVKEVPTVVVDEDGSALSRQLARMADASELVRVTQTVPGIGEAERAVRERRAHGVLRIPRGFQRDVLRGERVVVGAYGDASYVLVYRQVLTGLVQATGTLSAGVEVRRLRAAGLGAEAALARRDPLPLVARPLYNTTGGYATFVVPAVLVLILQQTLLVGIGMLGGGARERGEAELEHTGSVARALPHVLGRAGAYASLYFVHGAVYLFVVYRVFGFPRLGSPLVAMAFLLPFLLAVIFLGIALSSLFRERETAVQALLFSSLPAIFVSGFSWPPEAMPRAVRALSLLFPSTAGINGFLRVNQLGASLLQVRHEWLLLWALSALYLVAAVWAAAGGRGERVKG